MTRALIFVAVALPASYVIVEAVRVLIRPARWPSNAGRWIVWGRTLRHPRPSDAEIRFWALVWAAIGLAFLGVAVAAALTA